MVQEGNPLSLSQQQVMELARTARLAVSPAEAAALAEELTGLLELCREVQDADVQGVEPLVEPSERPGEFRPDEVRPGLTQEEALANAPDACDGYFRVPSMMAGAEGEGGGA